MTVAKADLGTKRVCPSCTARFYDLQKRPIECPICHFTFEPETLFKQRRPRQAEPESGPAPVKKVERKAAARNEENESAIEEEEAAAGGGNEDEEEGAETEEDEAAAAGMHVVDEAEGADVEEIEDEKADEGEQKEDAGLLEEVEEDGDDVAGIVDPGIEKDER